MNKKSRLFVAIFLFTLCVSAQGFAQEIPATDNRREVRHLDLTYSATEYKTKDAWLARAAELRQQILVSAGLWPTPTKQPIKAVIFDKLDRGDFTVEKVYFESYPGFYVTGNLYRPKNATGKLPAVLCPHGHWAYGRLENQPLNSGPARAISFARQGYVAFSYDMVGYNDSSTITHKFADHNTTGVEALWGVNLLGLQLWNSIRSVDFLLSLPEVDASRIACTGESGGGTQTFLLMAVDDRIKLASPVNMVSFLMQGGSLCENAPNLRIDTNNVELASLMAPRPMLMVSATGDWTKNTMTSEYPAVRSIYRLFGAEDKLTAVQMDAPHNYNQQSREAVYGWFAHWFLNRSETTPIKERSVSIPSIPELLVFYSRPRPENELDEEQLTQSLIEQRKRQLDEAQPKTAADLDSFKEQFGTAFKFSLMAETPKPETVVASITETLHLSATPLHSAHTLGKLTLSRREKGDRVLGFMRQPDKQTDKAVLVLLPDNSQRDDLMWSLADAGYLAVCVFQAWAAQDSEQAKKYRYFTTYNRTDVANEVQDILTALAYLQGKSSNISVVALGQTGGLALLARGLATKIDRMAIDAAQLDSANDKEFLAQLPIPGIRRAGDFTTAITLAPLTPLLIHNTGDKFRTEKIAEIYGRLGRAENFKTSSKPFSNQELLKWLSSN
ncbi:MAG: acetylxylan esterase [Acidobacteria bacterium]|nr:acetylxylan esterase [Acidobacteriota bacterium]